METLIHHVDIFHDNLIFENVTDLSQEDLDLITALWLQDLDDVASRRKNKARVDMPPDDNTFAFNIFARDLENIQNTIRDQQFAESIDAALDADREILDELMREEHFARRDRELAIQIDRRENPTRSADGERRTIQCSECRTRVCTSCKGNAHPSYTPCKEDQETADTMEFCRDQGWQRCPGCQRMIELAHGCYHMTCLCRTEFCYLCRVPWKNCACAQWDENRLLVAAQERVRDEIREAVVHPVQPEAIHGSGLQMPDWVVNEEVVGHRVNAMVEHLRDNHECNHPGWTTEWGPSQCETCFHRLDRFILLRSMRDDNRERWMFEVKIPVYGFVSSGLVLSICTSLDYGSKKQHEKHLDKRRIERRTFRRQDVLIMLSECYTTKPHALLLLKFGVVGNTRKALALPA
ncbi:hypothetical protein Clacol_005247 [Clathrus columnatus]|uniref:RBR-type E3 ubiquitin transferase n=1 Tax=Clathrus columnatus TaxID=1419009 RepID=A0AAV5AD09_9AGAM|nr:hypothetical protein Clacol_005247 [Clathrus columnatus]